MTEHRVTPHARPNRTAFILLFTVLIVGLVLTGLALMRTVGESLQTAVPTPQIEGITAIVPPDPLPDFTLTGLDGQPTSLSDFNGRYLILFFGYTHCPDFCPLTLAEYTQVKRELGDDAAQFAFLFVSVDGERDTPEALANYVTRFDPDFYAMTGDEQSIRALGQPYGLYFTLNKEADDDDDYTVDHSTLSYVIDPEQRLHAVISFSTEPAVITDYLRSLGAG